MSLPGLVKVALAPLGPGVGPLTGRLHIANVAFHRAKQLQNGARPRVEAGNHKLLTVALLEVLADTVSWSTT